MDAAMTDQPQKIFVVSLVHIGCKTDAHAPPSDPILALRGLLKIALRRFKLRCISVEEKTEQHS
jgi:hypothetical protein